MGRFAFPSSLRFALAAFGLLAAAVSSRAHAVPPEGTIPACGYLLIGADELDYLLAKTTAERARAREAFFASLEELRARPDAAVPREGLADAWTRVAFAKGSTAVEYSRLTPGELAAFSRARHPGWFRLAYRIRDARLGLGAFFRKLGERFAPAGSRAERAKNWVGNARDYLVPRARVSNADRTKTILGHAASKARELLLAAVDFLSPVPLPERWIRRTAPVFRKLERNAGYVPTPAELALLEEYGAVDVFRKRQALLRAHPTYFRALRVANDSARILRYGALGGAVGLGVLFLVEDDGVVDVERFLGDPRFALRDDQVQLVNETYPFPHLALRIGGKVYSYGQTNMTVSNLKDYLATESAKRSVQVATLDLTEAEVVRLQRYLELQAWKRYENVTFVNDCSSMAIRALELETSFRAPRLLDPSPSALLMHLAGESFLPKSRVSSVRLVTLDERQNPALHALRNVYINAKEAQIYLGFLPAAQANRLGMEKRFGPRGFAKHGDAVKSLFHDREDLVEKEIREDGLIGLYREESERVRNDPGQRKIAEEYFRGIYETSLRQLESRDAEVFDLFEQFYRLEAYAAEEERILGRRNFSFADAVKDPAFAEEMLRLAESLAPEK